MSLLGGGALLTWLFYQIAKKCYPDYINAIESRFGGMPLLPASYIDTRELDYGGEADRYRVLRFVDVDGKIGYLVLYGEEQIVRKGVG